MTYSTWLNNPSTAENDTVPIIKDMLIEKEETCVSIIVPTHRVGPYRERDRAEIHRSTVEAKRILLNKPQLLSAIDLLCEEIDFSKSKEGIGIFVSRHVKKLVNFPFPVTKKIIVNEFFHLQELIYTENYEVAYYLLEVSQKEIHLFKGMMDHLEEIRDENFPKEIEDNYEYNRPSRSNSGSGSAHVKEVEKDKSILKQERLKQILRATDKLLARYITTKHIPLLLCGPTKDISIYRSVTKYGDNIITSMGDNYKGTPAHDLGILAWLQIRSFIDQQKLKLLNDFKEKSGEGLGVCGVEDIWEPAKEGRGLVLLVEKDPGETTPVTKNGKLSSQRPDGMPATYSHVVDEIVTTVLEKNGKVVVMEEDSLADYGGIALIMRY